MKAGNQDFVSSLENLNHKKKVHNLELELYYSSRIFKF